MKNPQGHRKRSGESLVHIRQPRRAMLEMGGVPAEVAKEAMRLAGHKLPIKTKFVIKGQEVVGE